MKPAVVFDMDGVIVDNGQYHKRAWNLFCARYAIPFSEEKFSTVFFGRTNEMVLPDLFSRQLTGDEIKKMGNEKEAIYRDIYRPELIAAPGFMSLLAELKSDGIPVGVATSAPEENVDFVLQGLGIHQLFDVVIDDSMVSKGKPDPEIYLKAAALLGREPSACVVFEDSLSGTRSAWDAGAKVVAVTTTLPAEEHPFAHLAIADFREISMNSIKRLLEARESKN